MRHYLVLDIGGTFIKSALMDETGAFLERVKVPSDTASLNSMLQSIASLEPQFHECYDGVAVSMPGRIDTAKGIAHTAGAFNFIHDEPFQADLEAVFHKPVTIANDANCATGAELWTGALSNVDSGVVLVFGTGIGCGIVLDHKVYMGSSNASGEVTWMFTDSSRAFEDMDYYKVGIPHMWASCASSSALAGMYARSKGISEESTNCIDLFNDSEQGDQSADKILDEFYRNVTAGLFNIQAVLDVPRFALGGGISARPAFVDGVRRAVNELWGRMPFIPFSKPEIVTCKYGNDANLIGALHLHLEQSSRA